LVGDECAEALDRPRVGELERAPVLGVDEYLTGDRVRPLVALALELLAEELTRALVLDHEDAERPADVETEPVDAGGQVEDCVDGEGGLAAATAADQLQEASGGKDGLVVGA